MERWHTDHGRNRYFLVVILITLYIRVKLTVRLTVTVLSSRLLLGGGYRHTSHRRTTTQYQFNSNKFATPAALEDVCTLPMLCHPIGFFTYRNMMKCQLPPSHYHR